MLFVPVITTRYILYNMHIPLPTISFYVSVYNSHYLVEHYVIPCLSLNGLIYCLFISIFQFLMLMLDIIIADIDTMLSLHSL
jgi:hypothetical protein